MAETVLRIDNLHKSFGDRKVIDNLSLRIEKGDIYGFLGPNGSGKTTTIKMILGLIFEDSGRIEILGSSLQTDFRKTIAKLGAIIETPRFYESYSAYRNLKILAGLYEGISSSRVDEVLELVGLAGRSKDKVKTYSLGMKQRLGIAGALLNHPQIVILDEPTNGLDPQGMKEIRSMISHLSREQEITFFVSSHLLHEVEMMCNRVAIIHNGKKAAEGPVAELLREDTETVVIETCNGEASMKLLQNIAFIKGIVPLKEGLEVTLDKGFSGEVLKRLIQNGIAVRYAYPRNKSLESIFLKMTEGGSTIA